MTTPSAPHISSPLSEAQSTALDAIDRYIRTNDRPPTWDELAKLCSVTRTTIRQTTERLVRRGLVKNVAGGHRSLAITRSGRRTINAKRTTN